MTAKFIRKKWEVLRSIPFGDITSGYTLDGTPLEHPPRSVKIVNRTDSDVWISTNGIDPHISQPANSGSIYDDATNRTEQGGQFEMSAGDAFFVREVSGAPTTGAVDIEVIFASDR